MISRLTTCLILVLIILGLNVNEHIRAAQTGCFAGLKNLFSRQASYAKLAEELYKRTDSNKLDDNTKEATVLLIEIDEQTQDVTQEFENLVKSFSELKGREKREGNEEVLCEPKNIKNMRLLAQAMQRGGNLRPKKITEPIRRLNHLVIQLVKSARSTCFDYLAAKWDPRADEKLAAFKSYNSDQRIKDLRQLPTSCLFGTGETEEMQKFAGKLSNLLIVQQTVGPDLDYSSSLGAQIDKVLMKPCEEFMLWHPALDVLEPYTDLLIAAHIIEPHMQIMYKFYEDANEQPRLKTLLHKSVILTYAYGYRACTIFKRMGKDQLASLIMREKQKLIEKDNII